MQTISIWHNPRCTKSREGVKIVEDSEYESNVIKYLDKEISVVEMKNILQSLGMTARELMRTTEAVYKELKLKEEMDEDKLIEALVSNPKLIQRPIIIKGDKAIIGRPASSILEFLNT
ncbi:MAG: arsenate reductase (glutaredoxin) [Sulfurimonas sp.]|nr:arsenate reductase (glutaredoxin) [Sulfurimonas sp.]